MKPPKGEMKLWRNPAHRRRIEEIPPPVDQSYGVRPNRSTGRTLGERVDEGRDQPHSGQV